MQLKPDGLEVGGEVKGLVPRRRPLRDAWLRMLDLAVRMLTLGSARVVKTDPVRRFRQWDGIIK